MFLTAQKERVLLMDRLTSVARTTAMQRLAAFLLHVYDRLKTVENLDEPMFERPLSQETCRRSASRRFTPTALGSSTTRGSSIVAAVGSPCSTSRPEEPLPVPDRRFNARLIGTHGLWQGEDRPLSASTAWRGRVASVSARHAASAATSAREILTGLHEVMAKRGSAQSKLDQVVDLIADKMGSDVCSIYLLRDNNLELFATHGLRKEAVHVTRLRMGEGLVGTIARRAAS